jgi:hypothetical protein
MATYTFFEYLASALFKSKQLFNKNFKRPLPRVSATAFNKISAFLMAFSFSSLADKIEAMADSRLSIFLTCGSAQ